jgi:hypothetical protein
MSKKELERKEKGKKKSIWIGPSAWGKKTFQRLQNTY